MPENFILYHANSSVTGKQLKLALEIEGGTELGDRRVDNLIRWGNRAEIRYRARGRVLNQKENLNNASNKRTALEILTRQGVPTPPAATRFEGNLLVGRTASHMQGSGFYLVMSQKDFDLARHLGCEYFIRYVPCDREYRIHVFNDEVIAVSEKRMSDHCTSLTVRNFETGWVFHYLNTNDVPAELTEIAKRANRALGLHFGAVDIVKSTTGKYYVLEVNTAPSLVKVDENDPDVISTFPAFDLYVRKMKDWLRNGT